MIELPDWARQLDLSPHPEGGWFRETWRSDLTFPQSALPPDYTGPRQAGTAILFLLMPGQQSAWHTVRSAELWLWHRGSPLLLEVGSEQAGAETVLLGPDILAGQQPQFIVPPGHWQRAKPRDGASEATGKGQAASEATGKGQAASEATGKGQAEPTLVSCVVVPGFDFADFALSAG